jgi:parallel beta-helix repeat protein
MKWFIIIAVLLLPCWVGAADQVDFPDIYLDESVASGGVGSQADPYSDFSEINWTTGGDNSVFDYYAGAEAASLTINLKKGEVWRESFNLGGSGSATYPIIIQSYGSGDAPKISGSDIITGWTADGGCYKTAAVITTEPLVVIYDGVKLTENDGATTGVGANEWDWAGDIIYVNVGEDPDVGVAEAGQRSFAIWGGGWHHITVDGLTLYGTNKKMIQFDAEYNSKEITGVTIKNNTLYFNGSESALAIFIDEADESGGSNIIEGNTIYDVTAGCIGVKDYGGSGSGSGTETYIQNNNVYNCGNAGIFVRGNYQIIQENVIHDAGNTVTEQHSLHIYSLNDVEGSGDNNIIRYNVIYNGILAPAVTKGGNGMEIDQWCDNNVIYGNVIYNNDGTCITIYGANDTTVYGNSCYGNVQSASLHTLTEILIKGTEADRATNVTFKNNIIHATETNTWAIWVGPWTYDQGMDITNNQYFQGNSDEFYFWNTGEGDVLATWNALSGVGTDRKGDPLYKTPGSGDLTLQYGSPAYDAGINLGATYDDCLHPSSSWPSSVVTVDQDLYPRWEIGAYCILKQIGPGVGLMQ